MKDPYDVLGVPREATPDDLKRAYRRLARECHPDSDPMNPWAEDEFKELSAAYDLLSDPGRRAHYDGAPPADDGSGVGAKRSRASATPKSKAKPADGKRAKGARRSKMAGLKIRGADVEYALRVDFTEAAKGARRHISLANGKRLKVSVPPGTEDGRVLRLKGQGMAGIGGGDGDALVEVIVDPHPLFRREGHDIHVQLPVSLPEAVLGAKVEAPTIDGSVTVAIPKGSNTGTRLRLKGKGLPKGAHGGKKGSGKGTGAKGGKRGDQFVHLRVVLPKTPDTDLVRFVEDWAPGHPYKVRGRKPGKG
ncbi:MAG: DnaJ C-terminal domain-containing protein [Rhodospirillales bacterium]